MLRNHPKPLAAELRSDFWGAPNNALLSRKTVAAGLGFSVNWLEQQAINGGFIPYLKVGNRCLYRKSDVLTWLETNGKRVASTSALNAA